jgi:hypothetical protein
MGQRFVACDREQSFLMPPDVRDWLAEDHLAWFVIDAVAEMDLDVRAAVQSRGRGTAPRTTARRKDRTRRLHAAIPQPSVRHEFAIRATWSGGKTVEPRGAGGGAPPAGLIAAPLRRG